MTDVRHISATNHTFNFLLHHPTCTQTLRNPRRFIFSAISGPPRTRHQHSRRAVHLSCLVVLTIYPILFLLYKERSMEIGAGVGALEALKKSNLFYIFLSLCHRSLGMNTGRTDHSLVLDYGMGWTCIGVRSGLVNRFWSDLTCSHCLWVRMQKPGFLDTLFGRREVPPISEYVASFTHRLCWTEALHLAEAYAGKAGR